MKAVICQNGALRVGELPEPVPGRGQAVLNVLRCGICGSDLHARHHCDDWAQLMAETGYHGYQRSGEEVVFGHEFCGEVLDYGPDSKGPSSLERASLPCRYCATVSISNSSVAQPALWVPMPNG
jgi:threonine dehydrogenase-like Zn-dependent dehydrogenase